MPLSLNGIQAGENGASFPRSQRSHAGSRPIRTYTGQASGAAGAARSIPKRRTMFKGFFAFLSRGNVIDLAIAVVIGGAFGNVVTALVKDVLTPLIAALIGKPDFSALHFTINSSVFLYGDFLNALVSFLSVGIAIYFFVVVPTEKLAALRNRAPANTEPSVKTCPECRSEIPIAATRCRCCTSVLSSESSASK